MGKPGEITNLISWEEFVKLQNKKKNKFNAQKPVFYGIEFDSIKEGMFFLKCKADKHNGKIKDYELQKMYRLSVNNQHICKYYLDFLVINNNGTLQYIDTKGYRKGSSYALFKVKKKLMKACHGIEVEEL